MAHPPIPAAARVIARLIDHTLLRPSASVEEISELCDEALQYPFASVCVHPYWVPLVVQRLNGSGVAVCTVVGFPLGANTTETKVQEAKAAVRQGATEIDMVLNIGALCGGNIDAVYRDIQAVTFASHHAAQAPTSVLVKVILETALLSDERKAVACELCRNAGADFVKTSTGFSTAGATVADVTLLRATVGDSMGVKASGGVRTLAELRRMVAAGATRIGTSAGVKIVQAAIAELAG